MELLYCDRCGFRISDQDLAQGRAVRIDNKALCPKCAPPPLPNVGAVGKRQSGSKVIAPSEVPKRASLSAVPAHESRRHVAPSAAHAPAKPAKSANTGMFIAGGAGAVVLLLAFIVLSSDSGAKAKTGSGKRTQTETSSAAAAPGKQNLTSTSTGSAFGSGNGGPSTTADPNSGHIPTPAYEQPLQTPSALLTPPSKNDPEMIASDALDTVKKFEGLVPDDAAGRIKRLDEFLEKFGETIAGARARRIRDELKNAAPAPPPQPAASGAQPATDEYSEFTNYALAKNGATARGKKSPEELIDGNHSQYDMYHGYAQSSWGSPMFVVLKEPTELNCIRFLLWDRDGRFYRYKLAVCEDDAEKNWAPIVDKTDEASQCRSWQVLKFAPRKVKVIRVTGTFDSQNNAFHIVELQAFRLPDADPTLHASTKPRSNDVTLYSETFDGPNVEYMSFGECVDGPPGSNGKVMKLQVKSGFAKGGLYEWNRKPPDQKNLKFTFAENTHIRARYFSVNAKELYLGIIASGEEKRYEHRFEVKQLNTWASMDVALSELVQVDTGAVLKPGAALDTIQFETTGNEMIVYVDDLWIGIPGAPEKAPEMHKDDAPVTASKSPTYEEFLYEYHAALRRRDRAAAEGVLKAAKFPANEKELLQDAKSAEWLGQLENLQLKGVDKLKDIDSFELKPEKGNAITVGKNAKYRIDEVKNGIIYAVSDAARMPIAIESLQAETRDQLTQLALENDANGMLLRAFVSLLKLDAKSPAYQFASARSAIDKAKAAGAIDWTVLKRQLDMLFAKSQEVEKVESETARLELAAAHEWANISQLCDFGKWEQVRPALDAYKEKYGATTFASRKTEEIKTLQFKALEAPLAKGLAGYWKFDEGKGNATADVSGNHNNGNIVGAEWAQGRLGSGLSFNGAEDFVEVPDRPSLRVTDALTISIWFKNMGKTCNWGRLVSKGWHKLEGPWIAYGLLMNDGDEGQQKIKFQASLSNDKQSEVLTQSVFPANGTWHHIAGVFDGAKARLTIYVDGVKENEVAANNTTIAATATAMRIGDDAITKEKHKCVLDEVRIYNRALPESEVKALFNLYK